MGDIKTASLRELRNLPKESYKVIVMRFFPWWIKGVKRRYNLNAPVLAPSRELLQEFNKERKKIGTARAWVLVRYEERFRRELLRQPKALDLMRKLKQIAKERDVVLICKELTDEYCHRRIVREIMINYDLGD